MNPLVTININTDGKFPHLLEEAIYCALNQTYDNINVQVTCSHPDGLKVDTQDRRLIIHNIEKPVSFPHQLVQSIQRIKDGFWCTLDSDDLIFPSHVERMVKNAEKVIRINNIKDTSGYRIVCARAMVAMQNIPFQLYMPNWVCCLYTPFSQQQEQELNHRVLTYSMARGFDGVTKKSYKRYKKKGLSKTCPTYVYRLAIANHVSKAYVRQKHSISDSLPIITPRLHTDLGKIKSLYQEFCYPPATSGLSSKEWKPLLEYCHSKKIKSICEFGSGMSTLLFDKTNRLAVSYETQQGYKTLVETWTGTNKIQIWDGLIVPDFGKCDTVFVDGPRGSESREVVYKAISERKPMRVIAHDSRRPIERKFIKRYISPYYKETLLSGGPGLSVFRLRKV